MPNLDHYNQFFKEVTGFWPSSFQQRVARSLLAEKSIILQAPTGSGKTWAVVVPFLYSWTEGRRIADRFLYALPLRSLATSLFQSTRHGVSQAESTNYLSNRVRIQTGETKCDPLFEGAVTFTTIDQLLSSYLLHPVGLPKRSGNINAGALLGSLICFDEFHLLEPQKSMATAIEMLDTLTKTNPLSRFVLMTATLSIKTMEWLAKKLDAEQITLCAEEVAKLPSQQNKQRFYRWIDEPLSANAVAKVHSGNRSIVIVNTVNESQKLYEELKSEPIRSLIGPTTEIRLLHSRFFPADRQAIEQDLSDWFGTRPTKTDIILVSTQVIEAGLDFSCDNLHTEVAPMNAVVQRAGRCARRRGETGTVWCYALSKSANGKTAYGPYREISSIVEKTAEALKAAASAQAVAFSFHDELALVNKVHTDWELKQLSPLESLSGQRKAVRKAMDGEDSAAVRNLVRDVDSINVVITETPDLMKFNRQQWPEMLSVPPMSLYRVFDKADDSERKWVARSACEKEVSQGGTINIDWPELKHPGDLNSAGWLIAIHPSCAFYRADIGLVIGRGGPPPEIRYRERPKFERYSYKYETYAEHIRRVCAAGTCRDDDNQVATKRLAEFFNVPESRLIGWLQLIYQLHDVGKLSVGWQDAIWKWQETKSKTMPDPRPALAHSDYDPTVDWAAAKYPRPPHAAEGAYAVCEYLWSAFEAVDPSLPRAAFTAIVRHHGAFTSELSEFRLAANARQQIAETLGKTTASVNLGSDPAPRARQTFSKSLLQAALPEHAKGLLPYLYFVRRLRIADQNSFTET